MRKRRQVAASAKKVVLQSSNRELENESSVDSGISCDERKASSLSQCDPDCDWKDKLKWLQKRRDVGLWIQCCREECQKWRFCDEIHDPVDVPEIWYCSMQLDQRVAFCDYPEEEIPPQIFEDLIENKYNAGSIVWAHLQGYPWWPAMVDDCPNTFRYYEINEVTQIPTKYNVTFFTNDQVSCSWIPDRDLHPYKLNPKDVFLKRKKMKYHGISYKDEVLQACEMADEAQKLPLSARLEKFSFVARLTDDIEKEKAKRSAGPHNRTCPVLTKTRASTRKALCSENSEIPNKTARQTASVSRINCQPQEKTERPFKIASNNKNRNIENKFGDKTSSSQKASGFEKYSQTSGEHQKNVQSFSQVILNNSGPRKSICNETTARKMTSTSRIFSQTKEDNQKETERYSKIASNNKNRNIESKFGDKTPSSQNASGLEKYSQTSVEHQKDIQTFSQVILDNSGPRRSIRNETTAQKMTSTSRILSQIKEDSEEETEGHSKMPSNNKSRNIERIFGDERSNCQNTSLNAKKSDDGTQKRYCPVMLLTSEAKQKKLSDDKIEISKETAQHNVSNRNSKTQEKTKRSSELPSNNKSPNVERIFSDERSSSQNASGFEKYSQTSSEQQKDIQNFSQIIFHNSGPRKSIRNETTAQKMTSTSRILSQIKEDSKEETEGHSKMPSNNKSRNIERIFGDERSNCQNTSLNAKKSDDGTQKRYCPVMLLTSEAKQKKLSDDKIEISKETAQHKVSHIYSETQEKTKGSSELNKNLYRNANPCLKKISFDQDRIPLSQINSQTSVEKTRMEIESRPLKMVGNEISSNIKKVSLNESLTQYPASRSGINQETSVERVREMKRPSSVNDHDKDRQIKKVIEDGTQTLSYLDKLLKNVNPKSFSTKQGRVSPQRSIESEKSIERLSQVSSSTKNPWEMVFAK